jgi:rhodanese-related sulfurtransferase
VALLLKRRGVDRVRPLAGGFDAWRAAGHPVEPIEL